LGCPPPGGTRWAPPITPCSTVPPAGGERNFFPLPVHTQRPSGGNGPAAPGPASRSGAEAFFFAAKLDRPYIVEGGGSGSPPRQKSPKPALFGAHLSPAEENRPPPPRRACPPPAAGNWPAAWASVFSPTEPTFPRDPSAAHKFGPETNRLFLTCLASFALQNAQTAPHFSANENVPSLGVGGWATSSPTFQMATLGRCLKILTNKPLNGILMAPGRWRRG